jgi:hypothetical protein
LCQAYIETGRSTGGYLLIEAPELSPIWVNMMPPNQSDEFLKAQPGRIETANTKLCLFQNGEFSKSALLPKHNEAQRA